MGASCVSTNSRNLCNGDVHAVLSKMNDLFCVLLVDRMHMPEHGVIKLTHLPGRWSAGPCSCDALRIILYAMLVCMFYVICRMRHNCVQCPISWIWPIGSRLPVHNAKEISRQEGCK